MTHRAISVPTPTPDDSQSCELFRLILDSGATAHMFNTISFFLDYKVSDQPDQHPTISGYLMFINGYLISWGSKRQQSVALSSMEAEYIALCLATQEAVWLIEILNNIKFLQKSPIIIHEDNKACIDFSNHNVHHAKSKHIQQRYHYTRNVFKKAKSLSHTYLHQIIQRI